MQRRAQRLCQQHRHDGARHRVHHAAGQLGEHLHLHRAQGLTLDAVHHDEALAHVERHIGQHARHRAGDVPPQGVRGGLLPEAAPGDEARQKTDGELG